MSIDLKAHLENRRDDLSEERLTEDLNAECPNVKRLVADWVHPVWVREPTPPPIRWERFPHKSTLGASFCLYIPRGNCVLSIWPRRATFWQGTRWDCIWLYPEFQQFLRRACSDLAQLLGSSVAVYAPEVVPVEGDTLDDVIKNLRRDRGDPAPTIGALQHAVEPDLYSAKGCYYIDAFGDLPEVGRQ